MQLVNLTGRDVVLRDASGKDHVVPFAGTAVTAMSTIGKDIAIHGIPVPVRDASAWSVANMPPPMADTLYIVNPLVGMILRRTDTVREGINPSEGAVTDAAGNVVAVTRLVRCG